MVKEEQELVAREWLALVLPFGGFMCLWYGELKLYKLEARDQNIMVGLAGQCPSRSQPSLRPQDSHLRQ